MNGILVAKCVNPSRERIGRYDTAARLFVSANNRCRILRGSRQPSDRCVEGKADGLREGDECIKEAEAYKKCRQLVKEAKLKLRDAGKQQPR